MQRLVVIRYDSDHKPLVLGLSFSAPAVTADVPIGPPGRPLPKLHWDGSKREDYVSHLRASGTALAECERHAVVSPGDPAAASAGDEVPLFEGKTSFTAVSFLTRLHRAFSTWGIQERHKVQLALTRISGEAAKFQTDLLTETD